MLVSRPYPLLRVCPCARQSRIVSLLRRRGLLADVTSDALDAINPAAIVSAGGKAPAVYAGFDPTAPSLHLGNLVVLVAMKHFQAAGFKPVLLVIAVGLRYVVVRTILQCAAQCDACTCDDRGEAVCEPSCTFFVFA